MRWHRQIQGRCNQQILTIGSKFSQAYTYFGIENRQNNNKSITIDQNNTPKSIQPILLSNSQKTV